MASPLLIAPKQFHCALVAQLAAVGGSGKQAIYNALRKFLDDFLTMPTVPSFERQESLDHWHARVMAHWRSEQERQEQLIISFASILNGEEPCKAASSAPGFGEVFLGPWLSPTQIIPDLRERPKFAETRTPRRRPNMADADFVESLVRRMLQDARAVPTGSNQNEEIAALIEMWSTEFSPANPAYAQTWLSPEGLSIWLRLRGYGCGTPVEDSSAPVRALLAATISLCLRADRDLGDGSIGAETALFWIDSSVEDCQCFLRGYDNPAD